MTNQPAPRELTAAEEREQFEAWYLAYRQSTWKPLPSDNRKEMPSHWNRWGEGPAWDAWQAARASLPVALPPLPPSVPYVKTWRAEKHDDAREWLDSAKGVYFTESDMHAYARAAIEAASRGTGDAWISVEERLPEHDELVVAFNEPTEITVSCWDADDRLWHYEDGARRVGVTHWQPLPAPPASQPLDAKQGEGAQR